jgi:hypothetical protein
MKTVVAPAAIAVLLALTGALFWTEGKAETRLAEAHRRLATLQYADAALAGDQIRGQTGLARVPVLGSDAGADARRVRTTATYWDAEYSALAPPRDAAGTITESDPAVLLVEADAAFRTGQGDSDRSSLLRKLDAVVKSYAEVLKADPRSPEAAYNYEYTVRLRDNLQRARPAAKQAAAKSVANGDAGDLPSGPTLHGHPGGPPAKTDMSQFKIVIPKRGEERKDDPQAGKGGAKVRKG